MRKFHQANSLQIDQNSHRKNNALDDEQSNQLSEEAEIKQLEQQILILEEKQKNTQIFYEGKIHWLQDVLQKQLITKEELMEELNKLHKESQRQMKYIEMMKKKLLGQEDSKKPKFNKNQILVSTSQSSSQEKVPLLRHSKTRSRLNLFRSQDSKRDLFARNKSKDIQSEYFQNDACSRKKNMKLYLSERN